jgi:hypothetical protein
MITKVTITGADDSIKPQALVDLQKEFPFVEWGILLSRSNFNRSRYPSKDWLVELVETKEKNYNGLSLSCHLCGAYVRELLTGNVNFVFKELGFLWDMFDRYQINTHGEPHNYDMTTLFYFLRTFYDRDFIFQYDEVNTQLVDDIAQLGAKNISALFDISHGAGILPAQWPRPLSNIRCGYAGGLSPTNLKSQIDLIEGVVEDTPIWIDMETHVRSRNDREFDLDKVRECLKISSPYITPNTEWR